MFNRGYILGGRGIFWEGHIYMIKRLGVYYGGGGRRWILGVFLTYDKKGVYYWREESILGG